MKIMRLVLKIKNNQIMWELQLDFDLLTLLTDLRIFNAPSTTNPLDGQF